MILVRGIKLRPGESEEKLRLLAAKKLRVPEGAVKELRIIKKSLDARKKDSIHYVYSLAVSVPGKEERLLSAGGDISEYKSAVYEIPKLSPGKNRPLVVGFGPAGMFAALVLSRAGLKPVVLERGPEVGKRTAAVEAFRNGGPLDVNANALFGEGGAGTFSDGKLNTGINDRRLSFVLEEFRAHGAPGSVVYDAKPHIGTDILVDVVRNIREEIISLGGEVRFEEKLEEIISENGKLTAARVRAGDTVYSIDCDSIILATGHSARDTYESLLESGVSMERKPFSMGVRIEHRQSDIDRAQYGRERGELPAADYSLNIHLPDGTSAYTFCMCPGGEVFSSASEEGGLATNGMSRSKRDGENSNAALLVTLSPEDFPGEGVLAGMHWQREIERTAFEYGGENYLAPAQLVGDFLAGKKSTEPKAVLPTYRPGVVWGDIHEVLPERITGVLERALPELGRKLKGFDSPDAVLTAPETRSSSPVRILRGDSLEAEGLEGLYPCGEGAGYAGGISSAAVDGMRCAEALMKKLPR